MKNLYQILFTNFLKFAFIPIIIELLLVGNLFFINQQHNKNSETELEKIALISHKFTLDEKVADINNALEESLKEINATQKYVESAIAQSNSKSQLKLTENESYYLDDSLIDQASLKSLTNADMTAFNKMIACKIYLENIVRNNCSLISSAWINIDNRYSLVYGVGSSESIKAISMGVKNVNKKSIIFKTTYKEPWAQKLGIFGIYLAPIYIDGAFVGTIGFNINIDKINSLLKERALNFYAMLMLVDDENNLLATSGDEQVFQELNAHSFAFYNKTPKQNVALEKINASKKVDFEDAFKEAHISGTNLKLILFGRYENIFQGIEENSKKSQTMAYYVLALIIIINSIFAFFAIRFTRKIAKKISEPIKNLADSSKNLGVIAKLSFGFSSITEINMLKQNLTDVNHSLVTLIMKDDLTGLYNRRKLSYDRQNAFDNTDLALIDINRFSHINSAYGPLIGDEVLKTVAQRMRTFMGADTNVYRLEMDRFVILAQDIDDAFLDNLILALTKYSISCGGDADIEISVEVGVVKQCKNVENAILKSELALEEAQKTHVDFIFYYDDMELQKKFEKNIIWGAKLKLALKEDRLITYFQPIYNIKTGKVEKFESLVRLIEDGKPVAPIFFLDAARNMGLLPSLTRRVIEKTFAVAKEYKDIGFSINISFSDLADDSFFDYIVTNLKRFDIDPYKITLEILETEAIGVSIDPIKAINRLADVGFNISIDDFGSGYSNYSHLLNMEVDLLKVDGGFIKNIVNDKKSEKITLAILEFSKLISTKTVAEFVANEEIFNKVKEMGIDYAQGYFISPPVSSENIKNVINWTSS